MNRRGYRADIDGLRALAVLAVMGFHLFPALARGGFVGVDIFFVISGFLISSVLLDDLAAGRPRFSHFYAHRVRRIFPSLLVVLFASWAAGWVWLLPHDFAQLGKHIAGGAAFVANLLYWGEAGYFDREAIAKPLLHLWSLGVEEQFYLLWPLLLLIIWKTTRFRIGIFLLLLFGSFALSLVTVHHDAGAAFYSPIDRFWELMAGGALAYAARDARAAAWWRTQMQARHLCSIAGTALIVFAIARFDKAAVFPGWKVLLPVIGSALIIAAGPQAWLNRHLYARRAIVWIGLVSYPLYLWHWPLLSFTRLITGDPSTTVRVAIAAASIVLAALTYWLVELPIRTRPATPLMVLGLCALMAVAGGLGLNAFWSKGHPERLPPDVRAVATFSYDEHDYRQHDCLLFPDLHETTRGPDCLDADPAKQSLPEIIVWGDSHAAHLYPGMKAVYGNAFRISQLTASACPPILDADGEWESCPALNNAAFDTIVRRKPAIVMLGGLWMNYDWRSLPATIARLQAAGLRKIVIVGSVPAWEDIFPNVLARVMLEDSPRFRLPERTAQQLSPFMIGVDREMEPIVRHTGVVYESPFEILCNPDGCLTNDGSGAQGLITFDRGHLTPAGSRYLVSRFTHIN